MANIIVDGVELGDSVNNARQIINKRGKKELRLESRTFDLLMNCS